MGSVLFVKLLGGCDSSAPRGRTNAGHAVGASAGVAALLLLASSARDDRVDATGAAGKSKTRRTLGLFDGSRDTVVLEAH